MKLGLIILSGITGFMLFCLSGFSNKPMLISGIILFVVFILAVCRDAERV